MDAQSLLTRPEGKTLEFKRDLSSPDRVLRTLVAFANTAGGTILIGVEDKTRRVLGLADPLTEEERIANLIASSISPQLVPEIEILPWRSTQLLAVQIHPEWSTPHFLTTLGPDKGVFVRVGSTNRHAEPSIIAELQRNAGTQSYDEYPVPKLSDDALDLEMAASMFAGIREIGASDLQPLKLVTVHRGRMVPTVAGVLLIARNRFSQFPDAYIKAARFEGSTRSRVLDLQEIRSALPRMVDDAVAFVQKHTIRSAVFGGTRRVEFSTFPPAAVREAVVNAIIHADYSQLGGPIRLAIYDDRLEVENPGLLPAGITIEDLQRGVSKPRNRVVARFFHELRLAEQWGSGITRMIDACLAAGLEIPEFEEFATHFRVVLREASEQDGRPIPKARVAAILRILTQRRESGASASEVAQSLATPIRTVRLQLKSLVDKGLVVALGRSPNDPQRRYYATQQQPISPLTKQ